MLNLSSWPLIHKGDCGFLCRWVTPSVCLIPAQASSSSGPFQRLVPFRGTLPSTIRAKSGYGTFTNQIGRFDPATHTFMEVPTSAPNSQPYGIVVDASNNVWFTENNPSVALIGEYTSGGKLQEYQIRSNPPVGLTPHLITVDPMVISGGRRDGLA